jgi:hypothetical protein
MFAAVLLKRRTNSDMLPDRIASMASCSIVPSFILTPRVRRTQYSKGPTKKYR